MSHSSLENLYRYHECSLNQETSEGSKQEPQSFYPKGTEQAKNNEATPEGETQELGRSGSGLPSSWIINPLLPLKMRMQLRLASKHTFVLWLKTLNQPQLDITTMCLGRGRDEMCPIPQASSKKDTRSSPSLGSLDTC